MAVSRGSIEKPVKTAEAKKKAADKENGVPQKKEPVDNGICMIGDSMPVYYL